MTFQQSGLRRKRHRSQAFWFPAPLRIAVALAGRLHLTGTGGNVGGDGRNRVLRHIALNNFSAQNTAAMPRAPASANNAPPIIHAYLVTPTAQPFPHARCILA